MHRGSDAINDDDTPRPVWSEPCRSERCWSVRMIPTGSGPERSGAPARYRGRVPGTATPPTALSIAGSDSGGGAGAQADLKTFAAHRVHGTTALTAVTAQNTAQVRGVAAMEPDFVRLQIETVLDDFDVRSVKTGMLATRGIVDVVAELAAAGRLPQLVVDPVLVSSSGQALMTPDGLEAYRTRLLPHALMVTPNLREAAALTDRAVEQLMNVEAMTEAAEQIRAGGTRFVVVKGGHLTDAAHDVVAGPRRDHRARGRARGDRQRPRHRVLAVGRHRREPRPGGRRARGRAGGQGLRSPGAGRGRRLASRRGARAHRPFRMVGLMSDGLAPVAWRKGGRCMQGRRFWVVPLNVGF